MVQAKADYTLLGHFLVSFGISYRPLKIRYLCLKCEHCLEESSDPQLLDDFI